MIVLDYLRELKENEIIIPPFHTGHLGFIPETSVRIGLIAPYESEPSHCELIITPYDPSIDLAIIKCTMKDGVGVVKKLINALSSLKINIVSQESSSINHQSQHTINLIVDLSTYTLSRDKTYEWAKQKYKRYDYVFPISDYRFLKIFERILAYSGDSICWEKQNNDYRLQLYMTPIEKKSIHHPESIKVIPENSKNSVKIKIPEDIINRIRINLSPPDSTSYKLKYILFSDTKERNLRIYFPKVESWDKLIHIGFNHKDMPGALSAILDILAAANFNIITGLLRRNTSDTNIWEGLLEYRGEGVISKENLYEWVVEKINLIPCLNYDISKFQFRVGPPLYPKKTYTSLSVCNKSEIKRDDNENNISNIIEKTIEKIETKVESENHDNRTIEILKIIALRNKNDFKQRIFISYPYSAKMHVELIKNSIGEDFFIDEYQVPDGNIILDQVIKKIKACDFFLAIWHHEEQMPVGNGSFGISPWMPFEYGVALSENKENFIVRSSKLDVKIWKRINPAKAIPEYNDLTFIKDTLPLFKTYINSKIKESQMY